VIGRGMVATAADLLDGAVAAARAGGAVLVEGLQRPKQVQLKSERASIVTWADVAAQAAILGVITERFPDHAVLAEEDRGGAPASPRGIARPDDRSRGENAVTWLVDPLDGTSNYAHGVPFACTSVAVRDAEGLAAGAIFDPFRGELFTAVRGGGAWLDGERLSVSAVDAPSGALVCTGIQSDEADEIAAFGRRIVALSRHCRGVRCVGSPALCLAYVAAGRIEAFLERDATYAWDVGAGALLVTEAGGRIEDLDGGPLNLGPGLANVLASNSGIHAALAAIVHTAEGSAG
jgi:fructose-1,6-bisphosphatase/inositol monophosphatase family enzyme